MPKKSNANRHKYATNMLIATKYNQMKILADMELFRRFSFFDDLNSRRIEDALLQA